MTSAHALHPPSAGRVRSPRRGGRGALLRAGLASINPLLILDPTTRSDEAILWLADDPNRDPRPPKGLMKLGGERALRLLGKRVVMSKTTTDVLDLLRDQRNGIGHLGHADLDSVADHLQDDPGRRARPHGSSDR